MDEQKEFEFSLSPHTLISSVVVMIKERLKEQHAVDTVHSVKLIYRGFVMESDKSLDDYGVNPEYVILAIVCFPVSQETRHFDSNWCLFSHSAQGPKHATPSFCTFFSSSTISL
mgnify:CR=1 FL=1